MIQKIDEIFDKIKTFLSGIIDKINSAKALINKIEDEDLINKYKEAIALIFRELGILIKHYKPRKISGAVTFGLEDPATTGEILGAVYSIYPKCLNKLTLTPDFSNKNISGDIKIKGRIRLNHLAYALLVLYKNETIKSWIKSKED